MTADPCTGRADYALPRGARALEDLPLVHRVLKLALPLGLIAAMASGYWLGRSDDADVGDVTALDVKTGRQLAAGPLADLLCSGTRYLHLVNDHPSEPVLWRGVERMARAVLADDAAVDAASLVQLADVIRSLAPPEVTPLGRLLANHALSTASHRRAGD